MNRKVHSISAKHNVSIAISVMVVLTMIASIAYAYATFFYTASTTNGEFLSEIGSRPIFISDAGDDISLDIKLLPDLAAVNEAYPLDSQSSEVLLSLQNDYNKESVCKYNLYWQWSEQSAPYYKTTGESKEFTISGMIGDEPAFKETQLNSYSPSTDRMLLYTGYIYNSGGEIFNQTIDITTTFYKTVSNQDAHKGSAYIGKLVIDDVDCGSQIYNLSEYVISLADGNDRFSSVNNYEYRVEHETFTLSDGQTTVDAGYRYEGTDPDNYVRYNGETWRIIGVEKGSEIGLDPNKYYTKIIKYDPIGENIMWDEDSSDYATSSIYSLLNNDYLNQSGAYSSSSDIKGLSVNARSMIAKYNNNYSTWYLRGIETLGTTKDAYENERVNGTIYDSVGGSMATPIGLMYPSDLGFALYTNSTDATCNNKENLLDYNGYYNCKGYNWLYYKNVSWSITPYSNKGNRAISNSGYISGFFVYNELSAYPTLYLEHDIRVLGGEGTKESPYVLGNYAEPKTYYYAFGLPTTTSTTDYTTLSQKVFVRDDTPDETTREVCIVRNDELHCFQNNNVEYEQAHVQEVFSDISCDVNSSYVSCDASDFNCNVFSDGDVDCYDYSAGVYCEVNSNGHVYCGGF